MAVSRHMDVVSALQNSHFRGADNKYHSGDSAVGTLLSSPGLTSFTVPYTICGQHGNKDRQLR